MIYESDIQAGGDAKFFAESEGRGAYRGSWFIWIFVTLALVSSGDDVPVDEALTYANEQLFSVANGARSNSAKLVVILDDGKDQKITKAKVVAEKLRAQGIKVVVLSFGAQAYMMGIDNGQYGYYSEDSDIMNEGFVRRFARGLEDIGMFRSFFSFFFFVLRSFVIFLYTHRISVEL